MFTHFLFFPARYWLFLLSFIALVPVSHALSFEEALRLAQARAPQVRAAEDRLAAARAVEKAAAALPDPKLVLGLDNVPLDGPDAYSLSRDFMTMRRIGLMQDVPNQAKREARVAAARGQVAVAELEAEVARLTVLREAAVAWIARHTVERRWRASMRCPRKTACSKPRCVPGWRAGLLRRLKWWRRARKRR
jgi:outer membrane protein TolC